MEKYTIQQLAEILVRKNGLSDNDAQAFVSAIFDVIREGLEADKQVKVKGFGTFKIIDVDPRESVNVNTGERVLINGHHKITFTPDSVMKEMVNRPFSQFETVILNDGVDFSDIETIFIGPEKPKIILPEGFRQGLDCFYGSCFTGYKLKYKEPIFVMGNTRLSERGSLCDFLGMRGDDFQDVPYLIGHRITSSESCLSTHRSTALSFPDSSWLYTVHR